MLLDILIFIPILMCILFGFRDGTVRKLVAIVVLIAGLILGQLYMRDVGNLLAGQGEGNKEGSPMNGFLVIFIGMFIVQGLLYRILAKNYKIGGFADKLGGLALGFIEGALFVSSLLFIFAMSDFPDKNNKHDSQFYKSVVNIAPQILDMTSTLGPDAIEKIKGVGGSDPIDKNKIKKALPRPAEK
jgi:uncharacterized membrane protein required for colicin V production